MTGTLTIAARELRERSFVFMAAAVMAIVPLIAPVLPIRRGGGPLLVIMMMGTITAVGLTIALSIVMGGSMVARELSEKRLSFYFSKPVSVSAIWFGKVIGAIVTIALCFAITFIPAFLVAHSELATGLGLSMGESVLVLAIAAISFLLISHAVNTAIRSRSPLVALDLALFVGGVALVWRIIRPLAIDGAIKLMTWVAGAVLLMLPITLLAAGVWQLSRGRTDIRRSHRELSRFFWTSMAIVIVLTASYVAWAFSAGPKDIRVDGVVSNAAADWIGISGPASHRGDYQPAFLVDLKTGKSIRVSRSMSRSVFTRSGNAVVTIDPMDLRDGRGEIHVHRLEPQYSDQATGITTTFWSPTVLSDDLQRLAVFDPGIVAILSVHDLRSKTMMASVRIPFGQDGEMFFVSNDVVRFFARENRGSIRQPAPREIRIYEFNAKTRQLVQTGSVTANANGMVLRLSPDGSTAIVSEYPGQGRGTRLRIVDGRTGAERAVIEGYAPFSVTPLANGGVAFIASKDGSAFVRILDSHAQVVREISLGTQGWVGGVRELVPGQKYVANVLQHTGKNWALYVIDAQRGIVERIENNAVLRTPWRGDDPRTVGPSRSGEYVISDATNALWRWNALTGSKVKIF
jgi:ABC-type transport system involved in multi-copper enzyme maturation permease subunit